VLRHREPRCRVRERKNHLQRAGTATWPGTLWQQGGATVWAWLTFDPARNLLFYGTANPGVWNADIRPGDNKNGRQRSFARNPDSGDAIWAYQVTPHDAWDFDA
jgi:alcohol dehydrogenase (cytochrome c)